MNMVAVVYAPIYPESLPPASTHAPVVRWSPEHLLGSSHPRQQSGRRDEQILVPLQQAGQASVAAPWGIPLLALLTGSGLTHGGCFRAGCFLGPDSGKGVNRPTGNPLLRFLGYPDSTREGLGTSMDSSLFSPS